jgi:hypothetical protein
VFRRLGGVLGVRAPVRRDSAPKRQHLVQTMRAERPQRSVVGKVVDVHRDAVIADDVAAVDQHVATAVSADVAKRDGF